jgi:hypothetical protein
VEKSARRNPRVIVAATATGKLLGTISGLCGGANHTEWSSRLGGFLGRNGLRFDDFYANVALLVER